MTSSRVAGRRVRGGVWLAGFVATLVLATHGQPIRAVPAAAAPSGRIIAVGDVHGDFDALTRLLQHAGVIDAGGRWTGGDTTLVQTGDYTDRGAKVREVLDLLMALEQQAARAKGRAIVLIGNHEAMNMTSMLRDVSPDAYARFVDAQSEDRRKAAYAAHVKLAEARRAALARFEGAVTVPKVYEPPEEAAWMQARPPGYIEYVEAFGPKGVYGKWLRQRPALVRLGDHVFVHGGLNPEVSPRKLDNVSDQARKELERFDRMRNYMVDRQLALPFFTFEELLEAGRTELNRVVAEAQQRAGFAQDIQAAPADLAAHPLADLMTLETWSLVNADSPLWFRGFASWSSDDGAKRVDELQRRYGKVRFIVGHTMLKSMRITARFAARVFLIDTGMLSSYYTGGRASALEIAGDTYTAITLDDRQVLLSPMMQR